MPFVVLVKNKRTFASEYHSQVYNWKRVMPEVNDFRYVDYAGVASAYGAWACRVDQREEIAEALRNALDSRRPALAEVRTSKGAVASSDSYDKTLDRRV
jgi:acetolactate synthase-1/2/3 large subunit